MSTETPAKAGVRPRSGRPSIVLPRRSAVLDLLKERGRPLAFDRIASALEVAGDEARDALTRRLQAMEGDGQLARTRRGHYGLPQKMRLVRGRVTGHPDGYGFLTPDAGGDDLFLSPRAMRRVLHADRVLVAVSGVDQRGRLEATVVEVLERGTTRIVGRFLSDGGVDVVVPEDRRIHQDVLIPGGGGEGVTSGQIVEVEITEPPTPRRPPVGRVVSVLGEHMEPGMEVEIAIRKHGLPVEWPEDTAAEAEALPARIRAADRRGREDLRELPLVTIDGADARDFDDAVYAESSRGAWRLIVAIADVDHYVRPDSALDREARNRATSVYFPRRVIPMLPEKLSNGLCSLNPDEDRLCMACEVRISSAGEIRSYRFFEAVMRSQARLTYDEVAAALGGDGASRDRLAPILPRLQALEGLFHAVSQARAQRGSLDFDLPETRIVYDDRRRIERIEPSERNDAHRIIEECMLAANVCAARFLARHRAPGLYRVHDRPAADRLLDLRRFLGEFGFELGGGETPSPADMAAVVDSLEGPPARRRMIQTMMLRSLKQAVYSRHNSGHYALGYPSYAHFTSPIRRYPDLVVHRAIRAALRATAVKLDEVALDQLDALAAHCSHNERRADEAARDVMRWLKAEFMADRIGEAFDGVVSGVTNFGIFVELEALYVDGLVHISALGNDYFQFDPGKQRLIGERTRRIFRLGDAARVRLVRVDLDEGRIDFELAEGEEAAARPRGKRKSGGHPARRRRRNG